MTKPTPLTPAQVTALVEKSGYPFELQIARMLLGMGFDVTPGVRFFDRARGRDSEIDLLASRKETFRTTKGREVRGTLQLAVECKDSSLPYVLFGLPAPPPPEQGFLDNSGSYLHINTCRDIGHPERYGMIAFGDSKRTLFSKHHHFREKTRFHQASAVATIDQKGKKETLVYKLHQPDAFSDALRKLAAFTVDDVEKWQAIVKVPAMHELIDEPPTFFVKFFLLVHSTPHFRYTSPGEQVLESFHTPVFLTFSTDAGSTHIVIDFVCSIALQAAVETIGASFQAIAEAIVTTVLADTRRK